MLTVNIPIRFDIDFDHSEGDGPTADIIAQKKEAVTQAIENMFIELINENFDAIVDTVSDESGYLVAGIVADIVS